MSEFSQNAVRFYPRVIVMLGPPNQSAVRKGASDPKTSAVRKGQAIQKRATTYTTRARPQVQSPQIVSSVTIDNCRALNLRGRAQFGLGLVVVGVACRPPDRACFWLSSLADGF